MLQKTSIFNFSLFPSKNQTLSRDLQILDLCALPFADKILQDNYCKRRKLGFQSNSNHSEKVSGKVEVFMETDKQKSQRIQLQSDQIICCDKINKQIPIQIIMQDSYIHILQTENACKGLFVEYDRQSKQFVHLYQGINLETSRFKEEIKLFVNRKESFSGNVVTVHKIGDEHIAFNEGNPQMEISVVTEYVPWRLHLHNKMVTYEEALFLLDGSFRGFRELLHRLRFPFLVEDYMIGIDINGNVRVWWNREFCRNKFPFTLTSEIKLRQMVLSLVRLITSRMNQKDLEVLQQGLFSKGEITFLALQHNIQQMSKGLKLKVIGKNMINETPEVTKVMNVLKQINAPLVSPRTSRMISLQQVKSQERIIITPDKNQAENGCSRQRFINKRIYKQGFSPDLSQKMSIIKNDIESLRSNANSERELALRGSRSVSNLYSYNKGIYGNPEIPQVNTLIKQSQIIAFNESMTVSRFIEPTKSVLLPQVNPEGCVTCNGVSRLRKSETMVESIAPLQLSRIRSLQNLASDKEFFSNERSINESKMGASYLKNKFGESEKKLPDSRYFTRLFEV